MTMLPDYSAIVRAKASELGMGTPEKALAILSASVVRIRQIGDAGACLVASLSRDAIRGCNPRMLGLKLDDGRLALIATDASTWTPLAEAFWPADQSKAREPWAAPPDAEM